MRRNGTILGKENRAGMVNPLVDLVFNLMITMFVFLMIYMAVVVPRKQKHLDFIYDPLPGGAVGLDYYAGIGITGGSGDFNLFFAQEQSDQIENVGAETKVPYYSSMSRPGELEMRLDVRSGALEARFLADPFRENEHALIYSFPVTAFDLKELTRIPRQAACWHAERCLFFYKEQELEPLLPENLMTTDKAFACYAGKKPSPEPEESKERESDRIACHYAVRSTFQVEVRPRAVPIDVASNPLRLVLPDRADALLDEPFETRLAAMGGLEPYEFRLQDEPPWLFVDSRSGRLTGTPAVPGSYQILVELKDAQTFPQDWAGAYRNRETRGQPYHRGIFQLEIEKVEPLEASIVIPSYGRLGENLSGVVWVKGGSGRRTFLAMELPPGLRLDKASGEIRGQPAKIGEYRFAVEVQDEHPDPEKRKVRAELASWRVAGPPPRPGFVSLSGDHR